MTGPGVARAGGSLDYTITVNSGHTGDNGCKVQDVLPGDATFVSASNGGVYDPATQTVSWTLGAIPAATLTTLTVRVQVPQDATLGTIFVNQALYPDVLFGPFAQVDTVIGP